MNTDPRDLILATALSRRRLLRLTATAGATLMAGSLLAACGGDDDDNGEVEATTETGSSDATVTAAPSADSSPEPSGTSVASETPASSGDTGEGVKGGSFTAARSAPPPSLDFMSGATAAQREMMWFTIESLVAFGEDFTPIPQLAESWEVSDDALVYTFMLREGVKFHNGDTMVADDVIASLDRYLQVTTRKPEYEAVESYEAPDDHTVVFNLTTPSLGLPESLALAYSSFGVLPRDVVESIVDLQVDVDHMVGTGPYRLVEWVPDQHLRYERFDDYSSTGTERNGLGGGRVAYFDDVTLAVVPEASAAVAGLETGEYDFAAVPMNEFERLDSGSGTDVYTYEENDLSVVFFNHSNPISGNLSFRQAIQAVLNMEEIALVLTNGREGFFSLDPSIYFPSTQWHSDIGAALYNQADTEKARQLLDASGYAGEEIILVAPRPMDIIYRTILTVDEVLKSELDINTRVEVMDWPGQTARVQEQEGWHIASTTFVSPPTFGPAFWEGFMGAGYAFYENPEISEQYERFRSTVDPEERVAAGQEIQRIFHEDVAMVKICNLASLVGVRSDIRGYVPWYVPTRFWNCWRE